ncbi:MAG: single-stranded-DNA-specific exonuclease RecJ [Armatimonadota bacterium]|nr:single-stranded-DNA-specific exonuclease RecJ [Armatimonadota bacterium]
MISEPLSLCRWHAPDRDRAAEAVLMEQLGITSMTAAALVARGYNDPAGADSFLNPKLEDLHDPLLLPDAEKAVREIMLTKDRGEKIYVHGDYDVDGVTSAAIWTRSLKKLGFEVVTHVPHRMKEGYGIHESAAREAIATGAKLFLTCDCGTGAVASLAIAREAGMRIVVTDHHQPGSELPQVEALVNPHLPGSAYPFQELAGAGVAFKIAQAVAEACGAQRGQFIRAYLDLLCLGTIADVMPLIGENRVIAHFGLQALEHSKKTGLEALKIVSDTHGRALTTRDVGFALAPRLNAAGRVDDAAIALDLLLCEDMEEARRLAELCDQLNRRRKDEELAIIERAEELITEGDLGSRHLILVAAPGWHKGVVGIVASRIAERYNRPALVASIDEETGIAGGSARSIRNFHLLSGLESVRDVFLTCGGHAAAAGFSIESSRLEEAADRLDAYARTVLTPEDLIPTHFADAELDQNEVFGKGIMELQRLQPFGTANDDPRFIVRNTKFKGFNTCGDGSHVQFKIETLHELKGIAFRMAPLFAQIDVETPVDLLVEPVVDNWNGKRAKLQLVSMERSA